MPYIPPLNQIALSVVDLPRTERWFREGIGLLPSGGGRHMMRGPLAAAIQGLPGAASTCWWMMARNPWFQFELFQFERPLAKLMPVDFRPCDIGYTRIGIWVRDFDATLARLAALESPALSAAVGAPGARRACVRSPDGVYVELMEDDPLSSSGDAARGDCPAAVRSVTLSVPELGKTADFLRDGLGLAEFSAPLHAPKHEAIWGLPGACTRSKVFLAGDVLVEVVQYLDPVGQPRPSGYRICDQGILNIAFGAHNKRDQMEVYRRAVAAGGRPNCRPVHLPPLGAGVVYVNDAQDFSFEILWTTPALGDRMWGFLPADMAKRPPADTHSVSHTVQIDATPEQVWRVIADHEGMAHWSGFSPVRLTRPGMRDANGLGAERDLQGPPGVGLVREQVTGWRPLENLRYRVIGGSPFVCHQGEMQLRPRGAQTELTWTIRFRPKLPGTGWLFRRIMAAKLVSIMEGALGPYIYRLKSSTQMA